MNTQRPTPSDDDFDLEEDILLQFYRGPLEPDEDEDEHERRQEIRRTYADILEHMLEPSPHRVSLDAVIDAVMDATTPGYDVSLSQELAAMKQTLPADRYELTERRVRDGTCIYIADVVRQYRVEDKPDLRCFNAVRDSSGNTIIVRIDSLTNDERDWIIAALDAEVKWNAEEARQWARLIEERKQQRRPS